MATPAVNPIREGFHTITPYLIVSGANQFLEFLKQAFGATELFRVNGPEGAIMHAEVKIGDSMLELADGTAEFPEMPGTIHHYVKDTDGLYAQALRAGATSLREPRDEPYGDRAAGVKDPFGNRWFIATHIRDMHF